MSDYEKALLVRAGPHMLAARAQAMTEHELSKGCNPVIYPQSVLLEPYFIPITAPTDLINTQKSEILYSPVPEPEDIIRFRVWISPTQKFQWNRCELFIKQLAGLSHRVGLELVGNQDKVAVYLFCHRQDQEVIIASFGGKFSDCQLSLLKDNPLSDLHLGNWPRIGLLDFYPSPPYFHLLTCPEEFKDSPYESVIYGFSKIPAPGLGICQVLFQSVCPTHNWHRNIQVLTDLEYMIQQTGTISVYQHYAQQTPSGDLHMMNRKMETKAHNDKPIFATAFRMAVLGTEDNLKYLRAISPMSGLFQQGGRPLGFVTQQQYIDSLSVHQIRKMFTLGLTFRPGFLVNSFELTGLAHIPSANVFDLQKVEFDKLEPLSAIATPIHGTGTFIGNAQQADTEAPIFIPPRQRLNHTHLIGRPGQGKSLLEEHMILDDIRKGYGVAVLDPHGDMVTDLLYHIPEELIEKVIYFDPSDPEYIPIWNPMSPIAGQDIGRTTDDLLGVMKSFVTGWGDRMEHLLRHSIYGLKHIAGTSLLDVCNILQNDSEASKENRKLILEVVHSELAKKFWKEDFQKYTPSDFGPPKHKLSKLLLGGTTAIMLSQPYNFIDFTKIMNEGYIFLADLSGLGTEIRDVLGGFLLSIMHVTALGRSKLPVQYRKTFQIYLDEAHRFVTDSLEDIIAETRKYGVGLTLAHQYLRQFGSQKIDALSTMGTSIVFNVDTRDAAYLVKDFQEKAEARDFFNLGVGDAIVRIGSDIAKIRTLPPLEIRGKHFHDEIILNSRREYCLPVQKVHEAIAKRFKQFDHPFTPLVPPIQKGHNGTPKKREYARFRTSKER